VKRGHDDGIAHLVKASAEPRDGRFRGEQRLRGELSERHDHLWLDARDLRLEERRALRDLVRLGIAIAGRTALHDVGDVDLLAREAHGSDDLRQQLAGASDERLALFVFIGPRAFPDEHQRRLGIPYSENQVGSPSVQFASRAVADFSPNGHQPVRRANVRQRDDRSVRLRRRRGWKRN
jgi:hypothetical protein